MITDAEAQRIASEWHGGGGSALYALSSTGVVNTARDDHDVAGEVAGEIAAQAEEAPESHADKIERTNNIRDLCELLAYIDDNNPRGPVPGWYANVISEPERAPAPASTTKDTFEPAP